MEFGRRQVHDHVIGKSIYATVRYQYDSYFIVHTQDDASQNDGSFNFVIISTADFT